MIELINLPAQDVQVSFEILALAGGLLLAPMLPFVQRLRLPGRLEADLDVQETVAASRTAQAGIEEAAQDARLPDLDIVDTEGVNDG